MKCSEEVTFWLTKTHPKSVERLTFPYTELISAVKRKKEKIVYL